MIDSYRVLVLTDHRKHSAENSFYAIVNEMRRHEKCKTIHVASRGVAENQAFFDQKDANKLHGVMLEEEIGFTNEGRFFQQDIVPVQVTDFDLILMRLPRPIDDDFLAWLEEIFKGAVVVNRARGIIRTSNKKFLLKIAEYCPPIKLCHSIQEIRDFALQFPIVLKPLTEYGGKGILKIDGDVLDDGVDKHNTLEFLNSKKDSITADGYLAMKYLKNVDQGDKRIIVVDGEILSSSLRLPKEGSWLCNVAQGGTSVSAVATEREQEMIKGIAPVLHKEGILIYGVDTLVGDDGQRVISEINTLSIGGFPQSEVQTGRPIIKKTIDKIFEYANGKQLEVSSNYH